MDHINEKKCNLDEKCKTCIFNKIYSRFFLIFLRETGNIYGHECLVIDFTMIFLLGYMCAHTSEVTVEGRVALK